MFTATGEPTQAVVDGISARLRGDATLMALVTGVYGHLSEAARTAYPMVVFGRRTFSGDAGAMQLSGGTVSLQIDVWSNAKGPWEASRVLSRIFVLLERYPIVVACFAMVEGSLHCEMSEVFDEPDEDKPNARLYHGVQRWTAEIHEAA